MNRIYFFALLLPFFLTGCEKNTDLDENGDLDELSDDGFVRLAYDRTYLYPDDFYKDSASIYANINYVNTYSISPVDQRDSIYIELSTDDKNEALMWVKLIILNSPVNILLIDESETEKYFEFKCTGSNYTVLFRSHKTSYYCSVFNRFAPWNHANETDYGNYNAEIEKSRIKECAEYLWNINTFANYGQKVLGSKINEKNDSFEVHICSLLLSAGDWGMRDNIIVFDNYIMFDKNSKHITFKQLIRKTILGQQR